MQAVTPPTSLSTGTPVMRWPAGSLRPLQGALRWLAACLLIALGLSACGGGGSEPPASVTALIGTAGGTLTGPDGVQVVVPAGALTEPTMLGIARSSAGAPPLPEDNPPAVAIYEFTPHGLVFNKPVTIRMPVPANAVSPEIFMASLGQDWQVNDATLVGGFAEWQRNSFSFGMVTDCAIPAGSTDPYPCSYPRGGATANATPTSAITRIAFGSHDNFAGSAGSWIVNQPGTVTLTLNYQAAPDCSTARAKLIRWNGALPVGAPGRVVTTLFDDPVGLTLTTFPVFGGGSYQRLTGSTTVNVSSSLADTTNVFGFTFSCQRPGKPRHTGGDLITIIGPMTAAPVTTFTIGGTVSGLTGTGLVLQNNVGDNLAVPANATAFTFATAIAAGAPYDVTVQAQPAGQTCAVTNGSSTATGDVTNVSVSCTANTALGNWSAAVAVTAVGAIAGEPALGASSDGYTTLAWVQYETDQYNGYACRFDLAATNCQGTALIETFNTNIASSLSSGAYSPRVAMGANQRAHIVFGFDGGNNNYGTAMAYTTGSGWQAQMLRNTSSNSADLGFTGDGNTALMMWSQYEISRYAMAAQPYRYDTGLLGTSVNPAVTTPYAGSGSDPTISALGSSDAVAAWTNNGQIVLAGRFNGSTQTWAAPVPLNPTSTGNVFPPSVAGNAGGTAALIWLDLNNGYRAYASRLIGSTWSPPEAMEALGSRVESLGSNARSVAAGVDASGNAYFAWVQEDGITYKRHIYVRRCQASQPMSACDAAERINEITDTISQFSLAVSPTGEVWVVWVNSGSAIRVRRLTSTGWSTISTLSTTSMRAPAIAIDGSNRVTVAWVDATDSRIYVARHQQ